MKNIAIFGYQDGLTGQLLEMLGPKIRKNIDCIISISKIPKIKINEEHKKRPNNKTEFVIKNKIFGLPLIYKRDFIKVLQDRKIKSVFILEDTGKKRQNIYAKIKKTKIKVNSFVHKSVKFLGKNSIGEGVIIFPDCYIGYKSDIGSGCVIQSGCRIEHHNVIGNFCDINPNLTTGGFTKIGNLCEINISVDIINKITLGNNVRIGAGSLVLKNIKKNELHYGRPSKFKKKN